jgi:hypothetical protein
MFLIQALTTWKSKGHHKYITSKIRLQIMIVLSILADTTKLSTKNVLTTGLKESRSPALHRMSLLSSYSEKES